MTKKLTITGFLAFALAGNAQADKAQEDPDKAAAKAGNTDHADPQNKTLPSHASDTAKSRAFGQEGDAKRHHPDKTKHERHARAVDAAANEAKTEAEKLNRPDSAAHGANTKAVGPGSDRGASASAQAGGRSGAPANLDSVRNANGTAGASAAGSSGNRPDSPGRPASPGTGHGKP